MLACRRMPVRTSLLISMLNLTFDLDAIEAREAAASSASFTHIGGTLGGAEPSGEVACCVRVAWQTASSQRVFNDDEGAITDRAGAVEGAGDEVWVCRAVTKEPQAPVCTIHSEPPANDLGAAALSRRAADQRVGHGADLETEDNEPTAAARSECSRNVQSTSDEAVGAVHARACNAPIPNGGFVGEAGEGAGEALCQFALRPVRRGGGATSPKDDCRRELALSQAQVSDIRRQVLADAKLMSERDIPLSPAWWRQLGMEERAVEVETNRALSKRPRQGQPATGNQPSRYQLECVLEEAKAAGKAKVWYTVRWEGYHPFWEAWRISEEVGSPLE
eukprot:4823443-Pleurochrysis_carterae.AAC.1